MMELKVADRLVLSKLLEPVEGDVTLLRIVRSLREKLGFTEEETEALAFQQTDKQVVWNAVADVPAEIEISPTGMEIIATELRKASARSNLTLPQLALYERFVSDEQTES